MTIPMSLLPLALLGRLPLCCRRLLGKILGDLARIFVGRQRIAQRNLELAFPELTPRARRDILRQHFRLLGATLLDECALLTMSKERLRQFVTIAQEGELSQSSSLILVAPHFVGVSVGGVRISATVPEGASLPRYLFHHRPMHSQFWDIFYQRLRGRWQAAGVAATQTNAMWLCARHLQKEGCLFYLPDTDPKTRKSTVFVPFLGVAQTATTTVIGRLAALTGSRVALCVATMTPQGYEVRLEPVEDFLIANATANATRINQLIERHVRAQPAQYYWLHRRFKTHPVGERHRYD
ncbi:hypothetical protein NQX30_01390 [Candidatus Persebacteraceae bacterium Df01]|jgi:lauroyl/myristoyl acyltransferase|uniref:Lipid A biosynthesis acyltransferase n=1 Tax=Candidatus Doriopsillibacter californiensis TaxID=2970740 RepID=A0ABT7QK14_9GAMM|nr:hypothetical protein [Candidatus Persebacteraceae bacterium Df01]